MKKTLTALALLVTVAPSMGNAGCNTCPAPAPVCPTACAPTCATVCTQPVTTCTICCPKILGFANGGNRSGYWGASCNPCCN